MVEECRKCAVSLWNQQATRVVEPCQDNEASQPGFSPPDDINVTAVYRCLMLSGVAHF